MIREPLQLRSRGRNLDMSEQCLGRFEDSAHLADDAEGLRRRLAEEGHVYLPGYLDRQEVLDARRALTDRLAAAGILNPDHPPIDAVPKPGYQGVDAHEFSQDIAPLKKLLYAGRMIRIFQRVLGEPVSHFDWTWVRALAPGGSTPTHCDAVYMGRGARQNLYTAWTPLGDIDLTMGGLMILERSHLLHRLRKTYCKRDVDTDCENRPSGEKVKAMYGHNGMLAPDPDRIRRTLGGRWLVGEFQPGDLVIFNIFMVHGSLENQSDRIRLSSDTRYQPAHEPRDDRWIGPDPIRHGQAGKRAMIC